MLKFDVIILAGGLGTRLRSVISDIPKPMAPVNGKPFLDVILKKLPLNHISNVILSLGYKHEVVQDYYGEEYAGIPIKYAVEEEQLGTGGGIKLALGLSQSKQVILVNGDTAFDINYEQLWLTHSENNSLATLALKPMKKPSRYGTVLLQGDKIVRFQEKKEDLKFGLINGGIYLVERELILSLLPNKNNFSFETEFLEKNTENEIYGYVDDSLFIDIGIPEDYERAQEIFT